MDFSDLGFYLKGLVLGLSIAAPVGPIGVLCIQRTLALGRVVGFVSGLGAATADATYGSISAFGLTLVSGFLVEGHLWLHIVGGLFLLYLGVRTLISEPSKRAAVDRGAGLVGAYSSTLLLTLTNPLTILSFAAIFAGLGVGVGSGGVSAALMVAGVFCGSALWWLLLSTLVAFMRRWLTMPWLRWVNRFSGLVILAFAVLALVGVNG